MSTSKINSSIGLTYMTILGLNLAEMNAINQKGNEKRPKIFLNANDESGVCGEGVNYTINKSSWELIIFGKGTMDESPWRAYNTDIKSVVIEYGVNNIMEQAFSVCWNLKSIEISNSVTSIGRHAFQFCTRLTSINIPNSVTSIGKYAFTSCSRLESVVIPNSIISIEDRAFQFCRSLTSVTIPYSVTQIGYGAFGFCKKLLSINVDKNNINYKSINGVLYTKDGYTLICYPNAISGSYSIPDGVISIESSSFSKCYGLTSVTIPKSVISIGSYAFYSCSGLSTITLPDSVTYLGENVFGNCEKLIDINVDADNKNFTSIDGVLCSKDGYILITYPSGRTECSIPDNVTIIRQYAFSNCRIINVSIPNKITSIGAYAFQNCTYLKIVNILGNITSIEYC